MCVTCGLGDQKQKVLVSCSVIKRVHHASMPVSLTESEGMIGIPPKRMETGEKMLLVQGMGVTVKCKVCEKRCDNCRRRYVGGDSSHYCSQNCKMSFRLRNGLANLETCTSSEDSRLPSKDREAVGFAPARLPKRKSIRFGLNLLADEQD